MKRVIVKPYSHDRYELHEPYAFKAFERDFEIPKGYLTDGASVPRIFWSILPPKSPEYLTASITHDYLTDIAAGLISHEIKPSFKACDKVFKEHLKELGVSPFKTALLYYGVRLYHKLRYKD